YTTVETLSRPFVLLVTQSALEHAFGAVYLDDGVSNPPGPSTTVTAPREPTPPSRTRPAGTNSYPALRVRLARRPAASYQRMRRLLVN
ncbi:hypothetical protein B0H11DRAFT_2342964, partial [Mycena galericulata]